MPSAWLGGRSLLLHHADSLTNECTPQETHKVRNIVSFTHSIYVTFPQGLINVDGVERLSWTVLSSTSTLP